MSNNQRAEFVQGVSYLGLRKAEDFPVAQVQLATESSLALIMELPMTIILSLLTPIAVIHLVD